MRGANGEKMASVAAASTTTARSLQELLEEKEGHGGTVGDGGKEDGTRKPQPPAQNEAERFLLAQQEVSSVTARRKALVHRMSTEITKIFPNALRSAASRGALYGLMQRSFDRADQVSTEEDALAWAGGFRMPGELAAETERKMLDAEGDFDLMVARMRSVIDADRLSEASIGAALSCDNPEITALKELARGMPTLIEEDYIATSRDELPKVRGGMRRVGSAVEKLIHDNFVSKNLAFVMPVDNMPPGTLIHPAGLAPKAGAPKGRNTGDLGDMGGGTPLNSPEQKVKYEGLWGKIHNPTVDTLDEMFSKLLAEIVPRDHKLSVDGDHPDDPVILVMDLEGAYTLLSFLQKQVRLIATLISAGLVVFFLCGIFGWTGTPFAFNVVTRAIVWELERRLNGLAAMYVDDIAAGCLRRHLPSNIAVITQVCTTLLGSKAIKEAKTVVADGAEGKGWKATVIGYDFDLKLRRITISAKNVERAFYGFLTVDVD